MWIEAFTILPRNALAASAIEYKGLAASGVENINGGASSGEPGDGVAGAPPSSRIPVINRSGGGAQYIFLVRCWREDRDIDLFAKGGELLNRGWTLQIHRDQTR